MDPGVLELASPLSPCESWTTPADCFSLGVGGEVLWRIFVLLLGRVAPAVGMRRRGLTLGVPLEPRGRTVKMLDSLLQHQLIDV